MLFVLALVLLAALAPALAVAANNCAGMSSDCEGPCGTVPCAVAVVMTPPSPQTLAGDVPDLLLYTPRPPIRLFDLPPRSHSA